MSLSRPDMSLPLLVRLFLPKLQARSGMGTVRHHECQGALTQKRTLLGRAAHLSSLSTPFPLMQLAMMMAEVTPSGM